MRLATAVLLVPFALPAQIYFPPSDRDGGWRTRSAGPSQDALDKTFDYIRTSTPNGGLLVVRDGWLIFEKYFGRASREAAPNLASCGKSITSVAVGILIEEQRERFPLGLETRPFGGLLPAPDERMREIRLGQLLAMTAGIRGNNPGLVRGREVMLDPPGPDGAPAMRDDAALAAGLWCEPGRGHSYATSSVHLASMWLRAAAGMEMEQFVRQKLAEPLGWSRWGFAYKHANLDHTPGGGGIALRGTDMLRFLYLLQQEGRWGARQLVPASFVRAATRRSRYNPHSAYSLQFDINDDGHVTGVPRDAFWKSGSGGHALYVIPSLKVVAWKLGGRDGQYGQPDTGMPATAPSTVPALAQSRADPRVALEETLRRIVAAVRE